MKIKGIILIMILIISSVLSFGQRANKRITITGKVTDTGQRPVAGAVIFIDNVKSDVVTNNKGFYKIKVRNDAGKIMVFTLSQGISEEEINGRTTIDFILSGSSENVSGSSKIQDNEVVNIGYGTVRKRDAASGTTTVDFQDSPYASFQNIYDMIRGRFPGVEVSGTSIRIMGSSSLNVSTEPLFVVDGVIVNSIDDISPQNVKSIEVLKGPDATVYGTRGANGVIIITRLSGKDKK